ncbi:MAG: hypothetical protein RBT74_02140 [Tenuifilaceae bacterium]|jgi:hypothetical protein|nr:hypothetical protein [Tenuifilaceae bacterium]
MSKEKESVLGFRCSQKTKVRVQELAELNSLTVSDYLRLNVHLLTGFPEPDICKKSDNHSNNTNPKQ